MNGLGLALFLILGGLAMWVLFFLLGFIVPYWITLGLFDKIRPKRVFEDTDATKA